MVGAWASSLAGHHWDLGAAPLGLPGALQRSKVSSGSGSARGAKWQWNACEVSRRSPARWTWRNGLSSKVRPGSWSRAISFEISFEISFKISFEADCAHPATVFLNVSHPQCEGGSAWRECVKTRYDLAPVTPGSTVAIVQNGKTGAE